MTPAAVTDVNIPPTDQISSSAPDTTTAPPADATTGPLANGPETASQVSRCLAAQQSPRIRVLLADDHRILREGLASFLTEEPDLEVVAEANDGVEAVELAHCTHPDVVLMDITMPRLDGVGATYRITAELPGVAVIGLSMHEGEHMSQAMRAAGAVAYLTKGGPSDTLLATIRASVAPSGSPGSSPPPFPQPEADV